MSKFFSLHLLTRDIFEADNYSPIPVANEEEYRIVISKFPFQDPELDKVRETFMLLKLVEIQLKTPGTVMISIIKKQLKFEKLGLLRGLITFSVCNYLVISKYKNERLSHLLRCLSE